MLNIFAVIYLNAAVWTMFVDMYILNLMSACQFFSFRNVIMCVNYIVCSDIIRI